MRFVSALTAIAGVIIGLTALTLIPICSYERWKSDPLVPIMLVLSFGLFLLSCDCLDRADKARERRLHKSL